MAKTYDVSVEPTEDRAYTIFVQDFGRTGYARATLAPREGMKGEVPPMDDRPLRGMADMGMAKMMPNQIEASDKDRDRIGGIRGKSSIEIASDVKLLPGHLPMMMRPSAAKRSRAWSNSSWRRC